jgi:hypothetical protein
MGSFFRSLARLSAFLRVSGPSAVNVKRQRIKTQKKPTQLGSLVFHALCAKVS